MKTANDYISRGKYFNAEYLEKATKLLEQLKPYRVEYKAGETLLPQSKYVQIMKGILSLFYLECVNVLSDINADGGVDVIFVENHFIYLRYDLRTLCRDNLLFHLNDVTRPILAEIETDCMRSPFAKIVLTTGFYLFENLDNLQKDNPLPAFTLQECLITEQDYIAELKRKANESGSTNSRFN